MLAIDFPVPIFFDTDGSPLDDGMLYLGTANQNPEVSPVAVYWDAAGTQPAVQPIRTKNGYPARSGTQTVVYVATAYSMTVKNARGELVMYAPVSTDYSVLEQAQASVANLETALEEGGTHPLRQTVDFIVPRRVYVDKYPGVDPDGPGDSTAGFNLAKAALEAMGGGELILSSADYKLLNWNNGSRIVVRGQGRGATRILKNGGAADTHAVRFNGTTGAASALTANTTAGATAVTVASTAAFAAGAWAIVREATYISGSAGRKQQVVRIKSVSSPTVTFYQNLVEAYTTAASAELVPLSACEDSALLDLFIEGSAYSPGGGAFYSEYAVGYHVDGVEATNPSDEAAFLLKTAYDCHLTNVRARDGLNMAAGGYGYGAEFDESCMHSSIKRSVFTNTREVTFTNRTMYCKFVENLMVGNYDSGFNTHGAYVRDCDVDDNEVYGTLNGNGIAIGYGSHGKGDERIRVRRNTVRFAAGSGISAAAPAGLENVGILIADNDIDTFGLGASGTAGIRVQRTIGNSRSSDNKVRNPSATASACYHFLNVADFKSSDDQAADAALSYGFRYSDCTDLRIDDPVCKSIQPGNFFGEGTNVRTFVNGRSADDGTETVGSGAAHSGLVQTGTATVTFAGTVQQTQAVTFPAAFPAGVTPRVVPSAQNSIGSWAAVYANVTNTGFDLTLIDVSGTSRTGSATATWIAYG